MGTYKATVTNAGQELIADALAGGGSVYFVSAKTSSYAYPSGTNIAALTDIQDVVQTVEPFSAQVFNDTMLQVSSRFDNSQVTEAYYIQTIGLYAKLGDGDPVLFEVAQAITPNEMPAQSAVAPSALVYNMQATVQQASQLTVTVNPAGTATVQDILDLQNGKVNIVVIDEGEDIPVEQRAAHTWYLKVTDKQTISINDAIKVSPTMGLKIISQEVQNG